MPHDTFELKVNSLVRDALEEDEREGGRFDQDGWGNFFLDDWKKDPEAVREAWCRYNHRRLTERATANLSK